MPYLAGFITPQDYGALGNGVNDDTAAINNALNAAPIGGAVFMPPGVYTTSSPIIIPPTVRLFSEHSSHIDSVTCSIQPSASFTGASVILFVDQTTGGYSIPSNQQSLFDITLDCTLLTGSTIDGIQAQGFVHGLIVQDVQIRQPPNHGVAFVSNGSGSSYSHRFTRVAVWHSGSHGFSPSITDSTWIDCESIGAGGSGFNFAGSAANSLFIGCRSEFSGVNGYSFNGAWGTGNGSGGMTFTACSTDRSVGHGISISATGTVPLVFTNMMLRRDGSNGTGNALNVNGATIPVTFDGIYVHPGVNDDGTGTASPVTAVSVTSANYVNLATGWIHGITNTISNGGSNTAFRIGPNIGLATGTTASPTYVNNNPWGTDNGSTFTANLNANDQTGIKVVQASTFTNLNNAMVDVTSGAAGTDYIFKSRVSGDSNSRFGVNSSGQLNWGPGNTTFDVDLYRNGVGLLKTDTTFQVGNHLRVAQNVQAGSLTALGDNGVGELQLGDATTKPTSSPTGGTVIFSQSGSALPLMALTPNGLKQSLVDAFFVLTGSNTTFTLAAQTASTIALAVESSATYLMESVEIFSNTTGNTTFSWTGPTGATMQWNDTTASLDYTSTIGGLGFVWPSNAGTRMVVHKGYLVTAGTPGTLTLTVGVSAGTTTLNTGSYLRLTRLR